MSILPKKKPKLSQDEKVEETKAEIRDFQMNLKGYIRGIIKDAEALDAQRAEVEEKNYDDLRGTIEKQLEDMRSYVKYFDWTDMYLSYLSIQMGMWNNVLKANSLIANNNNVFASLKISPEMQTNFRNAINTITKVAESNLATINNQAESIAQGLGSGKIGTSSNSDYASTVNFLNKTFGKDGKSEEKGDKIDTELEKRNLEHD